MKPLLTVLVMLCLSSSPAFAQSSIATLAGAVTPYEGAPATAVSFGSTQAVISDGAGGFYFAAQGPEYSIYHVAADGTTMRIAGNGIAGFSGDNGPAIAAELNSPLGLALDASGNLLIADTNNSRIRRVTPGGIISTIAGTGASGFSGDGGPATSARLNFPNSVAVDGSGNILIGDSSNHRVRKVTPAGVISTIAGDGTLGFAGDNGLAVNARLYSPSAIIVDSSGAIFIADRFNSRVRKISSNGIITTVAGSGTYGFSGDGGLATAARLTYPFGLALDASGNLFIADSYNNRIRRVTSAGVISTVAGNGNYGFSGDGGQATAAQMAGPFGVALDTSGNLLIADTDNQRIRKVSVAGLITTVAGNGTHGFRGDGGSAVSALLDRPGGLAADAAGNLFIADTNNSRIRKVSPAGIVTTFAGTGAVGSGGDGGQATAAQLNLPGSVAVGPDGSVYVTDCSSRLRKISPSGVITTVATSSWIFCSFYYYYYDQISRGGMAVDAAGNIFVADTFRYRIYKVTPEGVISPFAGNGSFGFSGDGGSALAAQITEPWGIALDAAGNLYIADSYNARVRKVTPAGIISTVVGGSNGGFAGDGFPAISAQLDFPTSVAVDAQGNLFIADTNNNRIRKVDITSGLITTVAGNGIAGVSGDGGPPTLAQLDAPTNIAVDSVGNLYIGDSTNHRVRKATFALTVPTLTKVSPEIIAQGSTTTFVFEGTSFVRPLTINAGAGITVTEVVVLSETQAKATLTVDANATTGSRNLNVTTTLGTSGNIALNVVPPFPDLSISSSLTGNWEVGFNGTYTVNVANNGVAPTTGSIVVTDKAPDGFTFVSGSGPGWSCTSANQDVTCSNSGAVNPGESSTLIMTFAVGSGAGSQASHSLAVSVDGDLVSSNNTVSDTRSVQTPSVNLTISPLKPGTQATVTLSISPLFTHDITGTLTLAFSSSASIPVDDPAILFPNGSRIVSFTIPANSNLARFAGNTQLGAIAFQPGTVAGTITFTVSLQSGTVQTGFSSSRPVPMQTPTVHTVRKESSTNSTMNLGITVSSSTREITQLILSFSTSPAVTVSCGGVSGCTAAGNTLSLDVKSLFDTWFTSDAQYGSLSTLHVPLTLAGKFSGSLQLSLRNSLGTSNIFSVPLP